MKKYKVVQLTSGNLDRVLRDFVIDLIIDLDNCLCLSIFGSRC
jgi:hypothetical protein